MNKWRRQQTEQRLKTFPKTLFLYVEKIQPRKYEIFNSTITLSVVEKSVAQVENVTGSLHATQPIKWQRCLPIEKTALNAKQKI